MNHPATHRGVVALSFDAGGDAAGVPSILRTLRAHGVPVRFLLTRQADRALTDRRPGREQVISTFSCW